MLSNELAEKLNEQINVEFQSGYLYLAMSAYCDAQSMDGFAHWMRVQAQEEIAHGMKIYNYLLDLDAPITFLALPQPQNEFSSFRDAFEAALAQEKKLGEKFNELSALAMKHNDYMTHNFLRWFLDEQVEEIALVSSIVDKVKLVEGSGEGLYMLNEELGKRSAPAPEDAAA